MSNSEVANSYLNEAPKSKFAVCKNCFQLFTSCEVHTKAMTACPKCGGSVVGVANAIGIIPAVGAELLCLSCAYYKPWKLYDPTTDTAICVECKP
jgi:PHP family Zn ribbon phosphoesterase